MPNMSVHGIWGDGEYFGNLVVAGTQGKLLQDFQFPWGKELLNDGTGRCLQLRRCELRRDFFACYAEGRVQQFRISLLNNGPA